MFHCPISFELAEIPVLTDSGNIYNFYHIATHILNNGLIEPLTRKSIKHLTLIRNGELSLEGIDIYETGMTFMRLVNQHPSLQVYGIGDLSFLQDLIKPVNDFFKSLDNYQFINGITLFHLAAKFNNVNCMKTLYDNKISKLNDTFENNTCALHLACVAQHIDIVKWLLSHREINPNIVRLDNRATPLHLAIAKNNSKIIAMLAKHPNTSMSIKSIDGLTSIEYVIYYKQKKSLEILLMCSEEIHPGIIYANKKNNTELVTLFIEYYLRQMLHYPEKTRSAFLQYEGIQACIDQHQDLLWKILIDPKSKLNLARKFPHIRNRKHFDQREYFSFIQAILKNIKEDDTFFYPLLSAFRHHDIDAKINFLNSKKVLAAKNGLFKDNSSNIRHTVSLPNLGNF